MRIAWRFGLLVSVLLLFAAAFAGVILYQAGSQQRATDRLRDLVAVAGQAGVLGQEIQRERTAAAWVVVSGGSGQRDGFEQQTTSATEAAGRYERLRRRLSVVPPGTAVLLDRIDTEIGGLPALREQVRSGKAVSLSAVIFAYRILIADLISYRDAVAQTGAPPDLADEIRAAAALSTAAENVALEQVVVLGALAPGVQVTPAIQQDINATRTGYAEAITSFASLARPEWRSWLGHELVGPDIVAAQRLEDQVGRVQVGQRVQVSADEWNAAMSARAARIHDIEARADAAVGAGIDRLHDLRRRQTVGTAGGVVVVVLVAIALAVAMGRPLVRRLRSLRDTAQQVATHGLAQAVGNLRGGSVRVDPAEYAAQQTQVAVRGSDEIAEVGRGFNAVYREAIRTAVEQLILRRAAAENLVHLSRRGQMLLDLLTRLLDTVERDETDPERLDLLYRLDNAVTRTKRINLSLLLLGGAGASVPQRDDVSLHDVLRAAISQIELYRQVDLGLDQTGAAVAGGAVDEVAHLFAELLDNATKYSGPDAAVYVDLAATPDGVIVQVFDQGTLSDRTRERLNRQLASPGDTQFASIQSIGLVAVALIAARHGIQVHLRPNANGGTVAVVELPRKILRQVGTTRRDLAAHPIAAGPPAGPRVPAQRAAVLDAAHPVAQADARTQELLPVPPVAGGQPPAEPLIFNQVAAAFSFTPAAEEGWRAANRAAAPTTTRRTATGLPVRQPGDNLVPGSVATEAREQGPTVARDPARVSASVAAHVRGLSARRPRQAMQLDIQVGQGNRS